MTEINLTKFDGPRTPLESEWDEATELARSIFFKNAPEYEDGAKTWPMSLRSEARENTYVMFDKDRPISGIARLERDISIYGHHLRIGYVGSVCTHEEYRKLGLASTVLSATMKRFHENSVDFVCISGNREMYRKAGSRFVGGIKRFTFRKNQLSCRENIECRPANMNDIKTLAMLNRSEPIFSIRPISDYEIVLKYGYCVGRPVEFILINHYNRAVGYLLITKLLDKDNRKFRRVMEYAGDRQFIISALNLIIADLPENSELEIDVQNGDLLETLLIDYKGQSVSRPGTHCIIDFARTMSKLKPYFASYLPEKFVNSMQFSSGNESFTAWCNNDYLKIDGQTNLVWTILGTPPGEKLSNVQATGIMNELIETCFPIPLPPLEMNMI